MRVTFPLYISMECDTCGKRWCAMRSDGAYVCSLDDFEHPTANTRLDPPDELAAAPVAQLAAEDPIDPRDASEPRSLFDLMDEGIGL